MEIAEIQIIQKEMLNKKISMQDVARNNGIFVSKLQQVLSGKATVTQDKIDRIIKYVSEYK
jgi:transcriptional regulator with XRE-family HTH domain